MTRYSSSCVGSSVRPHGWKPFRSAVVTLAALVAFTGKVNAQTYPMNNSPVTTCLGFFTDSGGTGNFYGNNEDFVKTFTPDTPGGKLRLTVFSFILAFDDTLQVFDGNSTSAPLIGNYTGESLFNAPEITSTAADGSLTFHFVSNAASTNFGWEIFLSCTTSPNGGACCDTFGCTDLPNEGICDYLFSGTYQGDDTTCELNPCEPLGACCRPNPSVNACSRITESECNTVGGTYRGDDVSCNSPNPCIATCDTCPGDMNGDSLINGDDIQGFMDCYFDGYAHVPFVLCGCDDIDHNGIITGADLTAFCEVLLTGPASCPGG